MNTKNWYVANDAGEIVGHDMSETSAKLLAEEKKYTGYGYHGGGRPRSDKEARSKTVSISGTPSEIESLKKIAAENGKTLSRFVIEKVLEK